MGSCLSYRKDQQSIVFLFENLFMRKTKYISLRKLKIKLEYKSDQGLKARVSFMSLNWQYHLAVLYVLLLCLKTEFSFAISRICTCFLVKYIRINNTSTASPFYINLQSILFYKINKYVIQLCIMTKCKAIFAAVYCIHISFLKYQNG